MKKIVVLLVLIGFQSAFAQITPNPKVTKKSTQDTFINKIEITEDYTVVSMQYIGKSAKEVLKEYFEKNPDEKEQLARMNPLMRQLAIQQMMSQVGGSSFSIQPTSFLKTKDGRKFEFIKATNIPVAPDRQNVEPEKKYFFKVYFKKLEPGIQSVDLVEGPNDERDGFQYWNFYGVEVNNPGEGEAPLSLVPMGSNSEIIMSGKVFDAATNKPIAANIICRVDGDNSPFDSVRTSRTGYFEFLMNPGAYEYEISADGYTTSMEFMDLSKLKTLKNFERDIFLLPISDVVKGNSEEDPEIVVNEEAETEIERVDDKTLRLNNVYFAIGKANILEESHKELQKVVKMMNENPSMKIRVDGHTDNLGDSHLNKILSLDRAKNVRDYLISEGVDAERVSFKGWGDSQPLESNASEGERQRNRRVEIVILEE
jgi:OmpA-OmpF porin, OOP family